MLLHQCKYRRVRKASMPRSTARGRAFSRYRSAEAIGVVCKECGRPMGYLKPDTSHGHLYIKWQGSGSASADERWSDVTMAPAGKGPRKSLADVFDQRRRWYRCVRQCGATAVYRQETLRAKYEAAKAAGQPKVAL
jgi:hypothetical protein